jgi:hypothetical protein
MTCGFSDGTAVSSVFLNNNNKTNVTFLSDGV